MTVFSLTRIAHQNTRTCTGAHIGVWSGWPGRQQCIVLLLARCQHLCACCCGKPLARAFEINQLLLMLPQKNQALLLTNRNSSSSCNCLGYGNLFHYTIWTCCLSDKADSFFFCSRFLFVFQQRRSCYSCGSSWLSSGYYNHRLHRHPHHAKNVSGGFVQRHIAHFCPSLNENCVSNERSKSIWKEERNGKRLEVLAGTEKEPQMLRPLPFQYLFWERKEVRQRREWMRKR